MTHTRPEDRTVSVGSIKTRFWEAGEGEHAVLLIHGLGGFIEHWAETIGPLSVRFRVVALDLVGFGRSDKPPFDHRLPALADFVADAMSALDLDHAHVVGHSMGGAVALALGAQHPSRVDKLALITSAGFTSATHAFFKPLLIPGLGALMGRPTRLAMKMLLGQLFYDKALVTPEAVALHHEMASQAGASAAMQGFVRNNTGLRGVKPELLAHVRACAGAWSKSALVIWGREDKIHRIEGATLASEALPDARVEILDACGHMPQLEHPASVNRLLLDFLGGA